MAKFGRIVSLVLAALIAVLAFMIGIKEHWPWWGWLVYALALFATFSPPAGEADPAPGVAGFSAFTKSLILALVGLILMAANAHEVLWMLYGMAAFIGFTNLAALTHKQEQLRPRVSVTVIDGSTDDQPAPRYPRRTTEQWRDGLVTVWTGTARTVEFTYLNQKQEWLRRKVDVTRISKDPKGPNRRWETWYLHGRCHLRDEERSFNVKRIQTKILERSSRYDVDDWIEKVTGQYPNT